jgi:hypothetical protein
MASLFGVPSIRPPEVDLVGGAFALAAGAKGHGVVVLRHALRRLVAGTTDLAGFAADARECREFEVTYEDVCVMLRAAGDRVLTVEPGDANPPEPPPGWQPKQKKTKPDQPRFDIVLHADDGAEVTDRLAACVRARIGVGRQVLSDAGPTLEGPDGDDDDESAAE